MRLLADFIVLIFVLLACSSANSEIETDSCTDIAASLERSITWIDLVFEGTIVELEVIAEEDGASAEGAGAAIGYVESYQTVTYEVTTTLHGNVEPGSRVKVDHLLFAGGPNMAVGRLELSPERFPVGARLLIIAHKFPTRYQEFNGGCATLSATPANRKILEKLIEERL